MRVCIYDRFPFHFPLGFPFLANFLPPSPVGWWVFFLSSCLSLDLARSNVYYIQPFTVQNVGRQSLGQQLLQQRRLVHLRITSHRFLHRSLQNEFRFISRYYTPLRCKPVQLKIKKIPATRVVLFSFFLFLFFFFLFFSFLLKDCPVRFRMQTKNTGRKLHNASPLLHDQDKSFQTQRGNGKEASKQVRKFK